MRFAPLVVASALLGACAGGDRVTLFANADDGYVGGVDVIDDTIEPANAGDESDVFASLNLENQQARLRGRTPRLSELDKDDPEYARLQALLSDLPPQPFVQPAPGFASGSDEITDEVRADIEVALCFSEFRDYCRELARFADCTDPSDRALQNDIQCPRPRPGNKIEVRGYTDSTGSAQNNAIEAQRRADAVAAMIIALGFEVAREDVLAMGDAEAIRKNGANFSDENFRRVDVVIR